MVTAAPPVTPVALVDLKQGPQVLLQALGKDTRLVPYGGGNFGMPLELQEEAAVTDLIVPAERFFMRSNGPVPVIDAQAWKLEVGGHVERSLSLTLADLQGMTQRTLTAFLECAGNGRTRYSPVPEGTPWRNDACGTAIWEGVSLGEVLDRVGVRPGAVDLVAQGGDFPEMQRGLPLSVARDPDTLLVLRMNGEPLTVAHGAPVRLLTPGWAGIASTKWLVGLTVLDHAFAGYWNADNYVYWAEDGTALRPVEEMGVKSVIASPQADDRLQPGAATVTGYAWSGYGEVMTVEVSTDGGETWQAANLERAGRRAWTRFSLPWRATPGEHVILARATDERRLRQPVQAAWNLKGYGQNGIHAVPVTVE
jgi:DMSO/TMAO reductase YedYZ molybdopterin-dependent catalytic subunit